MKAGRDTVAVEDTETADGTVEGTVEDTVAVGDTGTVAGVAVELRRSSWRRWGRP